MVGVLFKETVCSIPAKVDNICPHPHYTKRRFRVNPWCLRVFQYWTTKQFLLPITCMCGILTCPCVIFILHVYTISLLQWSVNTHSVSILILHYPLCIRTWNPCIPVLATSDKVSAFAPNLRYKLCHSAVKHFTPSQWWLYISFKKTVLLLYNRKIWSSHITYKNFQYNWQLSFLLI